MTPAEVARRVGLPEGEATAFLAMLVREGRVRMCVVELVEARATLRERAQQALSA
jgi:hypothetical protein